MKKLFASILLALGAFAAHATTLVPPGLLNPAGSAAGQAIVSTGAGNAPAWGNVAATSLATQAANTVVANVTGSVASPTAFAMPSCSTANSALKYTLASGWSCGTTYALTTGALAQFAATTSAQLAGVVSDETGSGSLVFGTSPTISSPTISGGTVNNASVGATTPSTGKFTTLQATSTITPLSTAGIVGTVTNDSANAGSVGEYVSNTASGVALTTATTANVTSISLTAGDWDVTGAVAFVNTGGTTSISAQIAGISLTSATFTPIPSGFGQASLQNTAAVIPGSNMSLMPTRISVATTTTVYLIAQSTFTVSTMTANGFIRARRVR